ncbi:MAG: hypothetical protein LUE10_09745 [Alistipes sp.]|nr:hypothetical protein [Alistipes sp.]
MEVNPAEAKARNGYDEIYDQQTERMEQSRKTIQKLTSLLVDGPTLSVDINEYENYGQTYDMNGTVILPGHGMVFISQLDGTDESGGINFGDFRHIYENIPRGESGIMRKLNDKGIYTFVFPAPVSFEGGIITGDN